MPRCRATLAILMGIVANGSVQATEISISCSALGQEYEICKQGVDAWAKKTGNTVKIVSTPNSATERLALYQQLLAAGAGDIDVFQIDVVWPGILGQPLHRPDAEGAGRRGAAFPPSSRTTRSTASWSPCRGSPMPGCSTTARTCSRSTSAPVPQTWEELHADRAVSRTASAQAGNARHLGLRLPGPRLRGPDLQRARMGRQLRRRHHRRRQARSPSTTRRPPRRSTMAAGWVGTITPAGRAELTEEESRGVFQAGNARLHAQLALCLGAGARRGQPDQGQGRRRAAAARAARTASNARHARRLAAGGLASIRKHPDAGGRPRAAT